MPVAAAIVGASVIGGAASIYGASKNAAAARDTAAENNALTREMFGKAEGYLSPTIQRGDTAGNDMMALLGLGGDPTAAQSAFQNFLNSTPYQFQLKSGSDALSTSRAAKGMLQSGGTLKALDEYGQNLGGNAINGYLDRLYGISSQGTQAGSALAGFAAQSGRDQSQNNWAATNQQINSTNTSTAAINDILSNAVSAFGMSKGGFFKSSFGGK